MRYQDAPETDYAVSVKAFADLLGIANPVSQKLVMPPMWHWLCAGPWKRLTRLGLDGHLPTPEESPPDGFQHRRMFAGGRSVFLAPPRIDRKLERHTIRLGTRITEGPSTRLAFVTIRRDHTQSGRLIARDEIDLVYLARRTSSTETTPQPGQKSFEPTRVLIELDVTSTTLFLFSALTRNFHRIHYDLEFARSEGHTNLVVQGPLEVLLMAEGLRRKGVDLQGYALFYRLLQPSYNPCHLTVVDASSPRQLAVELIDSERGACAEASVTDMPTTRED